MNTWKILLLFIVVLDIRLNDLHLDHRQPQDLTYLDHVLHPLLDTEYLKWVKMSNIVSDILGRQVDPGESLSNTDLL